MVCMYNIPAGISWHVITFQRVVIDQISGQPYLDTQVHCSIIDDKSPQGAEAVVAIFKKSLEVYKRENPDVTEAFLRR